MQVTKDYRLARVSGPLTYNDITTASSEGRRDIWTERERGWDEAEAIDTGQNRILYNDLTKRPKQSSKITSVPSTTDSDPYTSKSRI